MAELADRVLAQLAIPPCRGPLPPRFGADAAVIVPRLVDLYAD
ncbi:hypothetical protein [Massilia sp. Se16.2.3]|nr:hypothetical protein [Massilia sp. Se16.2.3]